MGPFHDRSSEPMLRSKFCPGEAGSFFVLGHVVEDAAWRPPVTLDRPPQPLVLGGELVLGEPIEQRLDSLSRRHLGKASGDPAYRTGL